MLLWVSRGIVIGALVGCLLMTVVGYALGDLMGSLASLPSLGNPELSRKEALRLASYGAAYGTIGGAIIGGLLGGLLGHVRVVIIAAVVGALALALGGAVFGSLRGNDDPIDWTTVMIAAGLGAVIGMMAGAVIGLIASPLDSYCVGKLKGTS